MRKTLAILISLLMFMGALGGLTKPVSTTNIVDLAVTEPKMGINNSGTDEYCLTYETDNSPLNMVWQICGAGAADTAIEDLADAGGAGAVQVGTDAEYGQVWTWNWPGTEGGDLDAFKLRFAHDSTSGTNTQRGLVLERPSNAGTQAFETLLSIDNLDSNAIVDVGIGFIVSGGLMTTAVDASDPQIVNALSIGQNDIFINGNTLDYEEFDQLRTIGSEVISTADWALVSELDGETPAIDCTDCTLYPINNIGDAGAAGAVAIGVDAQYSQIWTWNWPAADGGSLDAMVFEFDYDSTSGDSTQRGVSINRGNGNGTQSMDVLLRVANDEQNALVATGISIQSNSGNMTIGLAVSDPEIVTAIAIGENTITVSGVTLAASDLEEIAAINGATITSDDWTAVAAMSGVNTGDNTPIVRPITTSTGGNLTINTITIATAQADYNLPDNCDSATGGWVTLIVRDSGETASLTVNAAEDTINYPGLTLVADEELDSPGAAFDSVTVVCMETNEWYAIPAGVGVTWNDGGAAD